MQTQLLDSVIASPNGREADRILRSCVHCGFCNATCPTYQLLGDELDGPRGRIYQIKAVLEGGVATAKVQQHLDRCLTCLACETTCPSGVEYGHLAEIGREYLEQQLPRPLGQRLMRGALRRLLPYPRRFGALLGIGRILRPLMPSALKAKVPLRQRVGAMTPTSHPRKLLLLDGCVQPTLTPATNAALIRVLDRLGIEVLRPAGAGCCGAVSQHLSAAQEARGFMRRNIDAWWPAIEAGAEAIVVSASGCGALVKEYGYHLRDDADYAAKAERVAALTRDPCELFTAEQLAPLARRAGRAPGPIAFHPPCTLQHAQRLAGRVEALLRGAGFELVPVADTHLCCGSAGTYSILQPTLSGRLRERKLAALESHRPSLIATANVGCQTHLQEATGTPVVHWIELFDRSGAIGIT